MWTTSCKCPRERYISHMSYATPRAHNRYPAEVRVGMTARVLQGLRTADVSRGGMAVRVPQAIPVDSAIIVAFDGHDLRLNATVKHCTKRNDGFVVGVEFGALTEAQRAAVERIVAETEQRRAS